MVVDEAHSVDFRWVHLTETTGAVAGGVQALHARLEHDGLLDEGVGPLVAVHSVRQVAEIILLGLKLGNAALVWHITAHFDKFRT